MRVRNFTWADLPSLVEFINLARNLEGDERKVSRASLEEELAQPGLAPEENCFLFDDAKELQAYSILHPELRIGRSVLELGIHPAHTQIGVEREIVRSALARAAGLGARVLHVCVGTSPFWGELLGEEGFSQVRTYWLMQWRQDELPSVEVPQGFLIERFQPGDEERLTQVQNASFSGSWGFCPNTVQEISYRAGMAHSPPEGILLLAHGDDTAGYCWTCVLGDSQNSIGVIGMVGIVPAYRGRGLSKPILLAGMEHLRSRGVEHIRLDVDGENSPALKLYDSVGFSKAQELYWFEARLSVG